jgi:hypothetical protein
LEQNTNAKREIETLSTDNFAYFRAPHRASVGVKFLAFGALKSGYFGWCPIRQMLEML